MRLDDAHMNILVKQQGSSLIEIVVTMLIFAIGLLGFSALQGRAQKAELESYQRVEAVNLINWMAAQIKSNPAAVGCYGYSNLGTAYVGTGYDATYACSSYGTTETQAQVVSDVNTWDDMLDGVGESSGGTATGGLVNARSCINYDGVNNTLEIALVWQGLVETTAITETDCAESAFGGFDSNTTVRSMVYTVRLADFGN